MEIPFLFAMLHGSNNQVSQSYQAFDLLKEVLGPGILVFHYKDQYGFPVWAVAAFCRNGVTADDCLAYWDNICDAQGVKAATSYAKELPFYDIVAELGEWKNI